MGYAGAVAVLILTPILWGLSHRYFQFIYFGNIGNAILKELLECFFISLFLVPVFGGILKYALFGIGSILLFLLKVTLISIAVIAAIRIVIGIAKAISGKK